MTAHMPPVPPDQQPKHGTDAEKASGAASSSQATGNAAVNTAEQGRTANTQQNTTHLGHQQDR